MPFTRTFNTRSYKTRPEPLIGGADRQHMSRELREISLSIDALNKAVKELQDYIETLP